MRPRRGLEWAQVAMVAAGTVVSLPSPASAAAPELTFDERSVTVSGATAGGSVAVFGVSHGFNGFTTYYLRNDELLVDEDGDGSVRMELELPLSSVRSVWAAVDMTSGELGLAAPERAEVLAGEMPSGAVSAEGDDVTAPAQRWAYALWVRPGRNAGSGSGAWGAIVGDGGARDGDGLENREVRVSASSFAPIDRESEERPPERLESGDLVLVVDPETLAVSSARLAGK